MTHPTTTIGLISDTHMPARRRTLPAALFDLFQGVDLILHAGDVGKLWVLDQLGSLAPVIAVHGNDDTEEAQRELPYQQVIAINGVRILLWHSHHPDWHTEMASRRDNVISPIRSVERAQRAGAQVAVFGHWHIPFTHRQDGVLVVNPGALASGSYFTRLTVASVALMTIDSNGQVDVRHVDLDAPNRSFAPVVDWQAGFAANAAPYEASIITPELGRAAAFLRRHLARQDLIALEPAISELSHAVWEGRADVITLAQVQEAINHDGAVPPDLQTRLAHLLAEFRAAQF